MLSKFQYPSSVIIDAGGIDRVFDHLPRRISRLFVVTGICAMRDAGVLDRLAVHCRAASVELQIYEGITTNPSNEEADAAANACKTFGADTVLGLGGGSSVDIAKIVALLATNSGDSWDYISLTGRPGRKIETAPLPIIAVPTTSGTGSESTPYAVITHAESHMKKGMGSPLLYPELVILDPELLALMPPRLIAITGLDAFGQALEGFTSGKSTLHSEHFGWASLEVIVSSLARSFDNPEDLDAKAQMAWGATLSGLSIGIVDVNLAHAMSHPLSGHYDIQHGLAVAMCTVPAINFNRAHVGDKYIRAAGLFGYGGDNRDQAADWLANAFLEMAQKFGLDLALQNYDVAEDDITMLAADAMEVGAIRTNAREVSEEDADALFSQVWSGAIE